MAKQCPRCWAKIEPGCEVCPSCGFEFVRKATSENPEAPAEQKRAVFPVEKKDSDKFGFTYKLVFALTLIWAVLSILGGIYQLADSETMINGIGFILSGVLSGCAFYFIRKLEHYFVASIFVLVSGAATLQIPLLIVALIISYLVYCNSKFFKSM